MTEGLHVLSSLVKCSNEPGVLLTFFFLITLTVVSTVIELAVCKPINHFIICSAITSAWPKNDCLIVKSLSFSIVLNVIRYALP